MVIGVPYRILDINDLVLNTGGVLIGIVAFLIIRLLFRIIDPRIGDQPGPYLSYARSIMTPEPTPVAPTSDSPPSLP